MRLARNLMFTAALLAACCMTVQDTFAGNWLHGARNHRGFLAAGRVRLLYGDLNKLSPQPEPPDSAIDGRVRMPNLEAAQGTPMPIPPSSFPAGGRLRVLNPGAARTTPLPVPPTLPFVHRFRGFGAGAVMISPQPLPPTLPPAMRWLPGGDEAEGTPQPDPPNLPTIGRLLRTPAPW